MSVINTDDCLLVHTKWDNQPIGNMFLLCEPEKTKILDAVNQELESFEESCREGRDDYKECLKLLERIIDDITFIFKERATDIPYLRMIGKKGDYKPQISRIYISGAIDGKIAEVVPRRFGI